MNPQFQKATSEASRMHDLKIPLLQTPQDATLREVKFRIQDITCASCVNSIESVVGNLDGVNYVMVLAIDGKATIKYVPELISAKVIKQTVEEAGFKVHDLSAQDMSVCKVGIKGMACTSCSESVERALQMVDGVKKAAVGLALGEAKVYFDPNLTDVNNIIEAIEIPALE